MLYNSAEVHNVCMYHTFSPLTEYFQHVKDSVQESGDGQDAQSFGLWLSVYLVLL